MDKQKKLVLQLLPVIIIILVSLFALIFHSFKSEEKQQEKTISTNIPEVLGKRIEGNKLRAYENSKSYERNEQNDVSALNLLTGVLPDTTKEHKSVQTQKTVCSSENQKKTVHYKKIKKQFRDEIKNTNQEYNQLIDESHNKTEDKQVVDLKAKSFSEQSKIVIFNSSTRVSSAKKSEINELQVIAAIHNEQTVTKGTLVKMRTLESFVYKGRTIPANTFIYGQCTFSSSGRIQIAIHSIPYMDRYLTCHISVYDLDGFAGILPQGFDTDSGKKAIASSSRKIGNSFSTAIKAVTGTNIAGELASIASENAINGISEGVNSKIKQNKATLTNNYRVILKFTK